MQMIFARLAIVFLLGVCLGSLVNWAIFALAWQSRAISPWSRLSPGASPRGRLDRVPLLGWFALRREVALHGPRFWVRPLLIELGLGAAFVGLYWWEVVRMGLVQGQFPVALEPNWWPLHWQFASHAILLCWMAAASFIDIDEKIIPDGITVTGTILGLVLAAAVPLSMLPNVAARSTPPQVGEKLITFAGQPVVLPGGETMWLEPVTAIAPNAWPPSWGEPRTWQSLAIGVGCYWLWCFALAPRIWRGRRGPLFALTLIAKRIGREFTWPPYRWLVGFGTMGVVCVWALGDESWQGLMTALLGLVGSGGIVWAVRVIGTAALKREAMGFGDVTLMMMIGTYLGWQACLIAFFLAPFAGLFVGVAQFITRRDDEIPYGPFLCLGTMAVVIFWAPIWMWAQPMFQLGGLVPGVLLVCLTLLGGMLAVWRLIKIALFGDGDDAESSVAR